MKRIGGQIIYNIFTPYPGTEIFNYCKQCGIIKKNHNSSLFNHQSPENFFCPDINKEKFREMASQIEKYVDNHNFKDWLQESKRTLFTFGTMREMLYRARNYGLFESAKRFGMFARALTELTIVKISQSKQSDSQSESERRRKK
jgi:hypothetical protein